MSRTRYYVLDDEHRTVPATYGEWKRYIGTPRRAVAQTPLANGYVRTDFTGTSASGPFQTRFYGRPRYDAAWITSDVVSAKDRHRAVVAMARSGTFKGGMVLCLGG